MVLYAVNDRSSFDMVEEWVDQICAWKGTEDVAIVLAATKIDLESERVVSTAEGVAKAHLLQCGFHEVNPKAGRSTVDAAFYDLVRMRRRQKKEEVLRIDFRPFCRVALLTFLMIQKRAKKGGVQPLGKIPSDVLLMISKMIHASRRDGNVWGVVLKKDGGGGKKCVVQ
jgi:hypothetical protein